MQLVVRQEHGGSNGNTPGGRMAYAPGCQEVEEEGMITGEGGGGGGGGGGGVECGSSSAIAN